MPISHPEQEIIGPVTPPRFTPNHCQCAITTMKQIVARILCHTLALFLGSALHALTYYVDYDHGTDAAAGTSPTSAWKHAPGDANASGVPQSIQLAPGDTVLFKGGVRYRGTVLIRFSGTGQNPITYKGNGWGPEKAIIDGTGILQANWQPCGSAAELKGNPNWQNVVRSNYQGTLSPFGNFFQGGEKLWIAQDPAPLDPFWEDDYQAYHPVSPANITLNSIRDTQNLTRASPDHYEGAHIMIWVNPNVIAIRAITGFNPNTHTVDFESLNENALYGDRDHYYCIANGLDAINSPGTYAIDEKNNHIYLWPRLNLQSHPVTSSVRSDGIVVQGGTSHLVIEGFVITSTYADSYAHGIWNNRAGGIASENVKVIHNELYWIKSKDGRKGAIEWSNANGLEVRNNLVSHCQRNSGLLIDGKDIIIADNVVHKVGYKGLWFMDVVDASILRNEFSECEGTHGNPVSVFTSRNVLVADNRMYGTGELLTYNHNENFVVHNNLLAAKVRNGADSGSYVLRENGDNGAGFTVITNNTILHSGNDYAMGITTRSADPAKQVIHNNIADGAEDLRVNQISHNVYTGLSWKQKKPEWALSTGEKVETDLSKLFENPDAQDYRLFATSSARNAGINLLTVIPQAIITLYSDYDFSRDIRGNIRGADGAWDIGAYEYVSGGNQPPVLDPIGPKSTPVGEQIRFQINATDPDGDPLTYSATGG